MVLYENGVILTNTQTDILFEFYANCFYESTTCTCLYLEMSYVFYYATSNCIKIKFVKVVLAKEVENRSKIG